MDEKSQKIGTQNRFLKEVNLEFHQPDDISEDAKLTDHIHKFGRLARSYHVVGRHRGLKNIYIIFVSSEVT